MTTSYEIHNKLCADTGYMHCDQNHTSHFELDCTTVNPVLRTRSKMRAALFLVAILLAVATVSSKSISYGNCTAPGTTPENGEISAIDVIPCDEDPCVLKRGGNTTVTINFIPHEAVTASKVYAWVFLGFEPFALPVPSSDACQGHGLTCPLKSGSQVEFVYAMFISEDFPTGSLKLDAGLNDQNGKSIICGKVALELV